MEIEQTVVTKLKLTELDALDPVSRGYQIKVYSSYCQSLYWSLMTKSSFLYLTLGTCQLIKNKIASVFFSCYYFLAN